MVVIQLSTLQESVGMDTSGVVPLICACCQQVVGVENAGAQAARVAAEAAYFCRACLRLPEAVVVARLSGAAPGAAPTGVELVPTALVPTATHPRPILADLCAQVDAVLAAQRAPGRVTRGTWAADRVQLEFEPQPHTPRRAVYAALPALTVALGVAVTGAPTARGVRLHIPMAVRQSARHWDGGYRNGGTEAVECPPS